MVKVKKQIKTRERLWQVLDDIDDLPDMVHPSSEVGYQRVVDAAKNRSLKALRRYSAAKRDPYCRSLRKMLRDIVAEADATADGCHPQAQWSRIHNIFQKRFKLLDSDGYNLTPLPMHSLGK